MTAGGVLLAAWQAFDLLPEGLCVCGGGDYPYPGVSTGRTSSRTRVQLTPKVPVARVAPLPLSLQTPICVRGQYQAL